MRLISVNEAAIRLGLSPLTIRRLIRRGELPAVHPTKRAVRLREEEVEALIRVGYRPREGAGRRLLPSIKRGSRKEILA